MQLESRVGFCDSSACIELSRDGNRSASLSMLPSPVLGPASICHSHSVSAVASLTRNTSESMSLKQSRAEKTQAEKRPQTFER